MSSAEAVQADRERIALITTLPEARGQLQAALNVALSGASVADAKIALAITADAYSPDEVAALVNGRKP